MSTLVGAAVSEVGHVRQHNEDSYLVDAEGQMFIVADGMGGHAAGEVASKLAVDSVRKAWSEATMRARIERYASNADRESRRSLVAAVKQSVMNAHLQIVSEARKDDAKAGMGTTFTGFLVAGGDAMFAHAGDSRAYLVRDKIAMLLSEDHTVLARMRAAGITDSEADIERAEWAGVLTNALGTGDATRVATFVIPLYSGDRFLLCSDGVHEYLSEAEVGEVMLRSASPALAAQNFVDLALERGGADNATAVVTKVVEAGETTVPPEQRTRDEQALERCPLLRALSPQERLRALHIMTGREIKAGKEVAPVALGERAAYIVLEGSVKDARGVKEPGAVIYPEALIDGTPMPDRSARAVTQELTRLLTIRRDDFLEITEEESDLGVQLYAAVAHLLATR